MQKEKKNEKKTVFVKERAKKPGKDVTRPQKTRKTARTAELKRIDGNKKAKAPLYEKKSEKPTSRIDRSASFEIIEPQKTLPQKKKAPTHERSGKLKVISLGGLQEIGKNITLFEYGNDIVVIDCGMGFPDEEMPGIDLVIPDFSYLKANADKVRAILVTHGHEDHIGAIPYLLREINAPVYGTRLSLGILEGKLDEIRPPNDPDLYTVEAGDVINLGVFKAEFVHVNHSIADACAIALRTPVGTVFHSGDFKLDVSPIDENWRDWQGGCKAPAMRVHQRRATGLYAL